MESLCAREPIQARFAGAQSEGGVIRDAVGRKRICVAEEIRAPTHIQRSGYRNSYFSEIDTALPRNGLDR